MSKGISPPSLSAVRGRFWYNHALSLWQFHSRPIVSRHMWLSLQVRLLVTGAADRGWRETRDHYGALHPHCSPWIPLSSTYTWRRWPFSITCQMVTVDTLRTMGVRRRGVGSVGATDSINHLEWDPRSVHVPSREGLVHGRVERWWYNHQWLTELCHRPIRYVKWNFSFGLICPSCHWFWPESEVYFFSLFFLIK